MPVGIFLYEIVEDFGTQIIADFYTGNVKISSDVLKVFIEKHTKKDLSDATFRGENFLYYSSILDEKINGKKLYLGFILRKDEDLISLKSMFNQIEEKIIKNFSLEKRKMQMLLKDIFISILDIMEKLKEPKIIQEKINEKTKKLLDDGKLQEARELIELGETIPDQLSNAVKQADANLKNGTYKKAKKYFLQAAELAAKIEEYEIVDILRKKADQCDIIPSIVKERELKNKEIKKILDAINKQEFNHYNEVIPIIEESIKLSNTLEDNDLIDFLSDLKNICIKSDEQSKKLIQLNKQINDLLKKL
ncbi:MAG: hypothetical protein ACTSQS_07875 [Promethearchaeota archaeon]